MQDNNGTESKEKKDDIMDINPTLSAAESAYKEVEGKGKLIGHIIHDFKNGKEIFVPAVESSEPQERPCGGINCPFQYSCVDGCMYPIKESVSAPSEYYKEWISLEIRTPNTLQWVLVWVEAKLMAFMAYRRAYPSEQGSMWDSPFEEVELYNSEIEYWMPMPKFTRNP